MAQSVAPPAPPPTQFLRPAIREALTGWLFALPWVLGFLVFTVGPMLFSAYASFTQYKITTPPVWTGLDNYTALFADQRFYQSLGNTFWMVVVKTPLVILASLFIALLLNVDVPGGKAFRVIFYLPNVLAGAAAVFLWTWILQPNGLFNRFLEFFGLSGPAWFYDPDWTKPGLVIMGMWWIGGNVLIYLAALKGIPTSLYEAAAIDGATGWQQVRHITLPLISPTTFFIMVTNVIGAFQIFTTAYIIASTPPNNLAQGGPGGSLLFYVFYLYNRAFGLTGSGGFQMGYASAMAWILFLIIMAFTGFQLLLSKRWVHYESDR
jgi:multiple sugar transport system permease protein